MSSTENSIIIDAIERSAIKAFYSYYEMTDGEWILYTPEYWYTSHIALGIKKKLPKFSVYLENDVSEIRSSSGPKLGRPSKRLSRGRADVSIWKYIASNDTWKARSSIEVKRAWNWDAKTLGDDIDRLAGFINETSLTNVYFVILSDEENKKNSAKKLLKKRCKDFHDKIQIHIDKQNLKIRADRSYKISKKLDESRAAVFVYTLSSDGRRGKR